MLPECHRKGMGAAIWSAIQSLWNVRSELH